MGGDEDELRRSTLSLDPMAFGVSLSSPPTKRKERSSVGSNHRQRSLEPMAQHAGNRLHWLTLPHHL
ncbi:MAG: hypothetical protein AAGG47_13865, partial [Pseudomonadota bacterium]